MAIEHPSEDETWHHDIIITQIWDLAGMVSTDHPHTELVLFISI